MQDVWMHHQYMFLTPYTFRQYDHDAIVLVTLKPHGNKNVTKMKKGKAVITFVNISFHPFPRSLDSKPPLDAGLDAAVAAASAAAAALRASSSFAASNMS